MRGILTSLYEKFTFQVLFHSHRKCERHWNYKLVTLYVDKQTANWSTYIQLTDKSDSYIPSFHVRKYNEYTTTVRATHLSVLSLSPSSCRRVKSSVAMAMPSQNGTRLLFSVSLQCGSGLVCMYTFTTYPCSSAVEHKQFT